MFTGLVALVAVALVIGAVLAVAVLVGTRSLGLGESESASGGSSAEDSMYLPKPEPTEEESGPLVTLAAEPEPSESDAPAEPKSSKPTTPISLTVGQTEVVPMGQIDLNGVYPGGEGAILQVQRFASGAWSDFGVTASVSNETFQTYVQTGQSGVNRFRMVDSDTGLESNEIKVTVSGG